jgi:4-hydroxybenzoate polyprenyltransferase
MAPIGAWIAVRGTFEPEILLLGFAVAFWIAGFDVLYALQDIEFDRRSGLYSIPAKFGIKTSLMIARLFHMITIGLLLSLIPIFKLTWFLSCRALNCRGTPNL